MSDANVKSEVYDTLRELSALIPEMRAAQLIAAVGELCADLHGRGLWDASDAEFLEALWQFRRNYEAATQGARWNLPGRAAGFSNLLTSYFPCNSATAGAALNCSRYRSRSSRAALTSRGSFFTFLRGSRLGWAGFDSAGNANCNRPRVLGLDIARMVFFINFLDGDQPL
jgi:hypothetical protein